MKSFPTLLRASDAADLRQKVGQAMKDSKDLYTPLFVDYSGELCQFVWPVSFCLYEYRLIEAIDLEILDAQVRGLWELNFEAMFNTVLWQGKYLQWMQRMNEAGLKVKDADAVVSVAAGSLLDNGKVDPAHRAEELTLVEDVREVLRLVPVDFSLAAPFLLGTE